MKHILECISSFKRIFLLLSSGFGHYMFHSCVLHPKSYLFCNWKSVPFDHFQSFFPTSYLLPLAALNPFSVSISPFFFFFFFFWFYIYNEILQYLHFSMWLISLRMMHSRSICVVINRISCFLWPNNILLCVCVCVCVCVFMFVHICTHTFSLSLHLSVNT